MVRKLIIPKRIICADNQNTILTNTALEITDDKIISFITVDKIHKKN